MAKQKDRSKKNSNSFSSTRILERDDAPVSLSEPLVLCGFVGPGLAGLTAVGYVIDHLGLHETAHVMSPHIPPSVVFIGNKIRHPFRIYKDSLGKIVVLICEVPVEQRGLRDISATLLDWFQKYNVKEMVTLDGIPIRELPENRPTFFIADERKQSDLRPLGFLPAESTLLTGIAGGILSESLDRKIPCLSLLVHVSITLMDPGAPLALIRALNSAYNLKITTKELEEDEAMIHEELNEIARQYQKVQEQAASSNDGGTTPKNMYG